MATAILVCQLNTYCVGDHFLISELLDGNRRGCYNGGQKCRDLSSDITKTSDPSPPTPNKVGFGAKWVKMSAFFGHNTARGSGGDNGMNPKPNKKLSLGAESYRTIAWKGFFTQSQVLLSSIVVFSITSCSTGKKSIEYYYQLNLALALLHFILVKNSNQQPPNHTKNVLGNSQTSIVYTTLVTIKHRCKV